MSSSGLSNSTSENAKMAMLYPSDLEEERMENILALNSRQRFRILKEPHIASNPDSKRMTAVFTN